MSWQHVERVLDKIVPLVVKFGYENVPGIRTALNEAGLDPRYIADFHTYEELFPKIPIGKIIDNLEDFELSKDVHPTFSR